METLNNNPVKSDLSFPHLPIEYTNTCHDSKYKNDDCMRPMYV